MLKLIVGLGNPGEKYEKTRHNAGFIFLDQLVSLYGGSWSLESRFQGLLSECVVDGQKLVFLKPLTYMNLSGMSVASVLRYYKFQADELLIVHDELDLPEGSIRLKRDGGHAGHNGLRDIVNRLGTRDFYRLRIGIGRSLVGGSVADYVLSRPSLGVYDSMLDEMGEICAQFKMVMQGDVAAFNGLMSSRVSVKKINS